MSYIRKIENISKLMKDGSLMILFSSDQKRRNRDVFYKFRNNSDVLYLTGFNINNFIFCLDCHKNITVYMDYPDPSLERWQGPMVKPDHVADQLGITTENIYPYNEFFSKLPELLKNKKNLYVDFNLGSEIFSRIFLEINNLNKNTRDRVFGPESINSSGQILHEARLFKSSEEIKKIKQAIDITGNAFIETMKWTRQNFSGGIFEYQIKSKIESLFQNYGSDDLAYPTIVAGGSNANYLHYEKCSDLVNSGDLVLVDAGCEWNHYASDITRTFPISGKFSGPQKDLYEITLKAQKNSIDLCSPAKTLEDIHNKSVATIVQGLWDLGLFKKIIDVNNNSNEIITPSGIEEIIEKKYYRMFYMHYTSHFLGLDVHDVGSYYKADKSRNLENSMVFTIEPGIYIPKEYDFIPDNFRGIGIRIEDNILIENNKATVLSQNIPKEVAEIEHLE